MRLFLALALVPIIAACTSMNTSAQNWVRDNTSQEQADAHLRECSMVALQVLKKSSAGLYRGGISTARSSATQMSAQGANFENTPHNRKVVQARCMEKKNYRRGTSTADSRA